MAGTKAGDARHQRERHIQLIAEKGRMAWQKATGYGRRSLVEAAIGRYEITTADCELATLASLTAL